VDAILTAGGIPEPGDPLYEYTQGEPKATLDIAGKPMIQWVVDALDRATLVDKIIIVGLTDGKRLNCSKAITLLPSHGDLLKNLHAGISKEREINPEASHVLSVSSDIPAITPEMVNWTIETSLQSDVDVVYNVITRQVMEARFPSSNRSYVRLKDVEVCGGDMNVIRTLTVTSNEDLWERIVASRKNALRQASLIGYDTLLLLLLRRITLEQGAQKVTKRLKITGRAVLCPYAEIGMDVDKPHQLEIMRADLEKRVAQDENFQGAYDSKAA
jgi:GTP:adenosylcobinamide-phosphate guanylyltransferase